MISKNRILFPILILAISIILFLTAWVSDDAFITLRTVDNWTHGYGLTWNISERVQTYTHPLWMFLLAGLYTFIPNGYFTALTLCLLISLIVIVGFFYQHKDNTYALIFGWVILISSKAFIDYSTSGLENPLTHLIVLLFAIEFLKSTFPISRKKFLLFTFLAGLGILNRMDTILFFIPAITYIFLFQHRNWDGARNLVIGFLPFILWGLFSIFYYGFLFPNTAYAKLNTDIPKIALLQQGLLYFKNSLTLDPITLTVTVSALGLSIIYRKPKEILLALGMGLYLSYILYIGGDFMSGRFFSTVVLLSVFLLLQLIKDVPPSRKYLVTGFILLLGFLPTVFIEQNAPTSQDDSNLASKAIDSTTGISDERLFYFSGNGLIHIGKDMNMPNHIWADLGKQFSQQGHSVEVVTATGMVGYFAGPNIHIVDTWAISDPLLARIKSYETNWRPGHFSRPILDGYLETLQTGKNQIKDPSTAQYYEKLKIIVSGKLWSWDRLKIIWEMNTGHYNDLIATSSE